jgi:hypothetical protein
MAERKPGLCCTIRNPQNINDGTSALTESPKPGPVGTYSAIVWDLKVSKNYVIPTQAQVLSQASRFLTKWESVDETPNWPGGDSGVTWGVGWDSGQHTIAQLKSDWADLGDSALKRLQITIGLSGPAAEARIVDVEDIQIPTDISLNVFELKTLPSFYDLTSQTFPGLQGMPAEVQVALISLVYNRGGKLGKDTLVMDNRWEMRQIRRAVRQNDLLEIYYSLGNMVRIWKGTDIERGMKSRRHAEQTLILPYVQGVLDAFLRRQDFA